MSEKYERILSDFVRKQYSDNKLEGAIKVCEDGKFEFSSCCCFIGMATSDHSTSNKYRDYGIIPSGSVHCRHLLAARMLPGGHEAEAAALHIGADDEERGQKLLAIFMAEKERRNACKELAKIKEEENGRSKRT